MPRAGADTACWNTLGLSAKGRAFISTDVQINFLYQISLEVWLHQVFYFFLGEAGIIMNIWMTLCNLVILPKILMRPVSKCQSLTKGQLCKENKGGIKPSTLQAHITQCCPQGALKGRTASGLSLFSCSLLLLKCMGPFSLTLEALPHTQFFWCSGVLPKQIIGTASAV